MDADLKFLIFYWLFASAVVFVFLMTVEYGYEQMLCVGIVLGFACAMTIVYFQERAESRRFHYYG